MGWVRRYQHDAILLVPAPPQLCGALTGIEPGSSETGLVVTLPSECEIAGLANGDLSGQLNLLTPAEIQWETGFEPAPQVPGNFNGLLS